MGTTKRVPYTLIFVVWIVIILDPLMVVYPTSQKIDSRRMSNIISVGLMVTLTPPRKLPGGMGVQTPSWCVKSR
jgi:hypothetical protein